MENLNTQKGKFVISLDFELMWGMRDLHTKKTYGENILGVWEVMPRTLAMFEKYKVSTTIAVVGFLFFKNKKSLEEAIPTLTPSYDNKNLSPYQGYFKTLNKGLEADKHHFCPELIAEVKNKNTHEIASHTFCHYYCLENGQTSEEFEHDLKAFNEEASKKDIQIQSIIFPRNQYNSAYLAAIKNAGITAYRGNETSWFFTPKTGSEQGIVKKICRFTDRYINLSGHNGYNLATIAQTKPYNIPSSRFLSPYNPKLRFLESLRLKRIKDSMTHAAKNNQVFHLWWHPHNFGIFQDQHFLFLEKILKHYATLNATYGFQSTTMGEITNLLDQKKE